MKTYHPELTRLRAISKCYLASHKTNLRDAAKYNERLEHFYYLSGASEAAERNLRVSEAAKKDYMTLAQKIVSDGISKVVVDGNLVYVETRS